MVKHVILWKFKEVEDLYSKKVLIKEGLEGLTGKIAGMREIKVTIDDLETSNCDAMLEVVFDDFESLKRYADDPLHVGVAQSRIRPYIDTRLCFDYEIN